MDTDWFCVELISRIPSPSGIAVLRPLILFFLHSHFLPRFYLSFKVLDRPSSSLSDF